MSESTDVPWWIMSLAGIAIGFFLASVLFRSVNPSARAGQGHDADCEARVVAAALADSALPASIVEHCEVGAK